MWIHWKSLCSLGFFFWAGMCGYDFYHGSIIAPGEFSTGTDPPDPINNGETPKANIDNKMDRPHEIPKLSTNEVTNSFFFWVCTVLSVSMVSVFLIVATIKIIYKNNYLRSNRLSSSSENIAIRPALFENYENNEPTCDNLLILNDNAFRSTKDEFVETTTSWKELVTLNKKLETLNEEKRSLAKFLAQSEKDNRLIKQKMMEILRDKNALLKRLECATREIRSNTIARQATLDKLEESLQCSNQLTMQVQQITTQKCEMERKIKLLEMQYKSLKKEHQKFHRNQNGVYSQPVKSLDSSARDSSKDIEQIELKLHDLEASLEKMKCKGFDKCVEEIESEDNDTNTDSYNEPRILRQVSSTDLTFLSDVEPSYTNLLTKFDSRHQPASKLQQIVESITPKVGINIATNASAHKLDVISLFGSTLFNILLNVQQQNSDCINCLVRRREPFVVNCSLDGKNPYSQRLSVTNCSIDENDPLGKDNATNRFSHFTFGNRNVATVALGHHNK